MFRLIPFLAMKWPYLGKWGNHPGTGGRGGGLFEKIQKPQKSAKIAPNRGQDDLVLGFFFFATYFYFKCKRPYYYFLFSFPF